MRTVKQPGIGPAERIQWVEARGTPVAGISKPDCRSSKPSGESLRRTGVPAGPAARGRRLRSFRLCDAGPLGDAAPRRVLQRPMEAARLSRVHAGALTLGLRDGAPFFHCHALWTEADGILRGGHVLPGGNLRRPTDPDRRHRTRRRGLRDGSGSGDGIHALRPGPAPRRRQRGRKTRVRAEAPAEPGPLGFLEAFCRERDIAAAELHGGVGSIIGASYRDGRRVDAFATEMAIRSGRISAGDGGEPEAVLDVALVDYTGAVSKAASCAATIPS